MSLFSVFDIGGSGMSAQSIRLNTTASNLANAESAASTEEAAYRAIQPVFKSIQDEWMSAFDQKKNGSSAVQVTDVMKSQQPVRSEYQPDHPMANQEGYVFFPNVNIVEEMTNMISASRSYQSNADVINTAKEMMLKTLTLGG